MKLNRIRTDGTGNIIVNDVEDSIVVINVNSDEVLNHIKLLIDQKKGEFPALISILVISTTMQRIHEFQENSEEQIPYFEDQYGDEPAFWRPFRSEQNIIEILKEYHEGLRI